MLQLGLSRYPGWGWGLAEEIAVSAAVCYPLLETVDLPMAALIEPLTVAVRTVKNSGFQDFGEKTELILGDWVGCNCCAKNQRGEESGADGEGENAKC